MLIWRGMGLMVFAIFGGMFLLVGLAFTKSHSDDWLHFTVTCLASAALWFLFLKRIAKHKENAKQAEQQLLQPEYLDEKTRKRAEMMVKSQSMMGVYDYSHFFFIPLKWWHYVFAGLALVGVCVHFFT